MGGSNASGVSSAGPFKITPEQPKRKGMFDLMISKANDLIRNAADPLKHSQHKRSQSRMSAHDRERVHKIKTITKLWPQVFKTVKQYKSADFEVKEPENISPFNPMPQSLPNSLPHSKANSSVDEAEVNSFVEVTS